jgi:cation:H+ antiporter
MDMLIQVCLLILGLALLWKAAQWLVDGSVAAAAKLHITPLVIGLTVVAMGTSAPEVAASVASVLRNQGDVAVANVFGSNIANLALVAGLAATLWPLAIRPEMFKFEMPILFLASIGLYPVLKDQYISRPEAVILFIIFSTILALIVIRAKKNPAKNITETTSECASKIQKIPFIILLIVAGLAGLALGADITVRSAVYLGNAIGLSKATIGLTIIALGTSLPELITSIVAALKKHADISIGNLVGSNIFNTLLVTGCAGTVKPFSISSNLAGIDFWIMVGITALFIILPLKKRRISRNNGLILLLVYASYMTFLFVR